MEDSETLTSAKVNSNLNAKSKENFLANWPESKKFLGLNLKLIDPFCIPCFCSGFVP